MRCRTSEASDAGGGLLTTMLVVFVILKLCGLIDWPWVWVLAPFWIPVVFGGGILLGWWVYSHYQYRRLIKKFKQLKEDYEN